MIKYVVSFMFTKNGLSGFGNTAFDMDHRIKGVEDLTSMGCQLKDKMNYDSVVILFYKEIETADKAVNVTIHVDDKTDLDKLTETLRREVGRRLGE